MTKSADDIRQLLGKNGAMLKRCAMNDCKIRDAATEELERVNARLEAIKPGEVTLSPALAREYRSLIEQRGKLNLLLVGDHSRQDLVSGD